MVACTVRSAENEFRFGWKIVSTGCCFFMRNSKFDVSCFAIQSAIRVNKSSFFRFRIRKYVLFTFLIVISSQNEVCLQPKLCHTEMVFVRVGTRERKRKETNRMGNENVAQILRCLACNKYCHYWVCMRIKLDSIIVANIIKSINSSERLCGSILVVVAKNIIPM